MPCVACQVLVCHLERRLVMRRVLQLKSNFIHDSAIQPGSRYLSQHVASPVESWHMMKANDGQLNSWRNWRQSYFARRPRRKRREEPGGTRQPDAGGALFLVSGNLATARSQPSRSRRPSHLPDAAGQRGRGTLSTLRLVRLRCILWPFFTFNFRAPTLMLSLCRRQPSVRRREGLRRPVNGRIHFNLTRSFRQCVFLGQWRQIGYIPLE